MGSEPSSTERIKCGYSEHGFSPFQGSKDEPCNPHCLVCGHRWNECNWHWVKEDEPPEPRCEGCGHAEGEGCGCPPKCVCGHTRGQHSPALYGVCLERPCACLRWRPLEEQLEEPPMTPKEEEEAPEDEAVQCWHTEPGSPCDWNVCRQKPEAEEDEECANKNGCYRQHTDDCAPGCRHAEDDRAAEPAQLASGSDWHCMHKGGCSRLLEDVCRHGCRDAADELIRICQELPPPEAPEGEGPSCSEIEGCDGNCCAKAPPPPQPDMRPPYLAAYSVQGHLYEVALPGDATVRAVDGALVITHALGPVAGIVQCAPMQTKEGA